MHLVVYEDDPYWVQLNRPMRALKAWPSAALTDTELIGPCVLDVFEEQRQNNEDDLVGALIRSALDVARAMGHSEEFCQRLRSAAWRSAHRFVVENVAGVDRGRELEELSKLLGVVRG